MSVSHGGGAPGNKFVNVLFKHDACCTCTKPHHTKQATYNLAKSFHIDKILKC